MTEATRSALLRIEEILHQAGWDQSSSAPEQSPHPVDLPRLRQVHESLVRHDHFDLPRAILGESMTLEQFAEKMATDEGGRRLRETLGRIRAFVDSCEGVESASDSAKPSVTIAEPR
jgi:hypothetical protein